MTSPPPTHNHPLPHNGQLHVHKNPDPLAPTALLLGWYGADYRHLHKYARIYHDLGYTLLMTIAPHSVIFSMNQRYCRPYIQGIIDYMRGNKLGEGGLVVQGWSNGGAFLMRSLGEIMEEGGGDGMWLKGVLGCVVFDSCPCFMSVESGVNAISMRGGRWRWLLWWVVYPLFLLLCVVQWMLWGDARGRFWRDMGKWRYGGCKEIYMWSSKDELLDEVKLGELLDERVEKGCDVVRWRVTNAKHVLLLRSNRRAYVEYVHKHVHQQALMPLREKLAMQKN